MDDQANEPSSHLDSVTFQPIGYVASTIESGDDSNSAAQSESRIVLNDSVAAGLEGVEPNQEILIVFWFHLSNGYELYQHPKGDTSRPKRGVFALRSPHRPNPIGITRVRVASVDKNVISVTGLDAWNGTPVLDIKPAVAGGD